MSDRAPLLRIAAEETATLVVALLNSFLIDFAARSAVGGTDLSYFIIKQLPVMPGASVKWLQAFRDITNATNERTLVTSNVPWSGIGNNAPVIDYEYRRSIASVLVLANMNSFPLDWAARFAVGGVHMNFFILRQLPVLPPEVYLDDSKCGHPWVHLIVPRVLELTYTSEEMSGFAKDLGYQGPPFPWNEQRRHRIRSELDAIFAQMYGLRRSDLEWILNAPPPSSSFPSLKQSEIREYGEYRTQRYVLKAFDSLDRGTIPDLSAEMRE